MKQAFAAAVVGMVLAAGAMAEPAHKPQTSRGVDLEAAARATAALYASMPGSPAPAAAVPVYAAPQAAVPVYRPAPAADASVRSVLLPPAPVAPVAPVQVVVVPQAAAAPQAIAAVWEGAYRCEHAEKVLLRPDAVAEQVELQWKGQRWKMRRIDSRSGAMRLEDASARMVWIQLANKSMLLDQHQGRRLLDECQHDEQVQTAARMKTNPPPALFDTTGMGR